MTKKEEQNLVRRAKDGDRGAWTELHNDARPRVARVVRRVLRWRLDDVEDTVQDAMLKTFTALCAFNGDSRFNTWACRIGFNQAVTLLRERAADAVLRAVSLPNDDTWDASPRVDGGYDAMNARMDLVTLSASLSAADAATLASRYLDGLSVDEFAALLNRNNMTAKMRTWHAMRRARIAAASMR